MGRASPGDKVRMTAQPDSGLPQLVKYCRSIHDITNGCGTIQAGTYQYYRELDPSFAIADPTEGSITFTNHGKPFVLREDQAARLGMRENFKTLHVKEGGALRIETKAVNCLLFCASRLRNKSDLSVARARQFDPEYDAAYVIENPARFGRELAVALHRTVTIENFTDATRAKLDQLPMRDWSDATARAIWDSVRYLELREHEFDQHELQRLIKDRDFEHRVLMCKDAKDTDQAEFRFVLFYHHPDIGFLEFKKEPVLFELNPFAGLCKSGDLS